MSRSRLELSRAQILSFRRRVSALDQRLPLAPASLRQAAWAGLQDSMPRAALFSIHARVAQTTPSTWEDPSLVQVWGPHFSVFIVARRDLAVFSLARLPDDARGRQRAEHLAGRLRAMLDGRKMGYGDAGDALGVDPNSLRYAAATGTVLIRWDGARQPTIWTQPPPEMDAGEARLELARRYLHIYGPATTQEFGRWAGIGPRSAVSAFAALGPSLTAVQTPVGDGWILSADEAAFRTAAGAPAAARLLPSGDAYLLLHGAARQLLIPNPHHQALLWPTRVWPGGVLVDGEIVGTWRRSSAIVTVQLWRTLSPAQRQAVTAEAHSLPLAGGEARIALRWQE
ncbi:MAG: DNA glycosylase AlkZ-like family protein [Sulfobacillus sp.]